MDFPRIEGQPLLHAESLADQIYLKCQGWGRSQNGNNLDLMQGLVEHDSGLQGAAVRRTVDAMIATSGWRKALPNEHWFAVLAAGRPAYGGARLQCLW